MFRRSFSSDSELPESFVDSKSVIRVSVCLQRYFKDVRSRCYMHVVRNHRVCWLEKRIQRIFGIPGSFCLCSDGHLLPSSEPLAVLRADDCIEVIPLDDGRELLLETNVSISDKNEKHTQIRQKKNNLSQMNNTESYCISKQSNHIIEKDNDLNTISKNNMENDMDEDTTPDGALRRPTDTGLTTSRSPDCNGNKDAARGESHESEETSQTLRRLKRHALALLDASCPASEAAGEPRPRRARRRVRRRARRPPSPSRPGPGAGEPPGPPGASTDGDSDDGGDAARGGGEAARGGGEAARGGGGGGGEVARNEAAGGRAPRLVRPLEADD